MNESKKRGMINMGNEEKARKLTRDEKFAVQQMGRFWKDWMYLKESDVPDYVIIVNKYHPTQTKRVRRIDTLR